MHERLYQQKQRETGVFFWNYAIKMRVALAYTITTTNRYSQSAGRIANLNDTRLERCL